MEIIQLVDVMVMCDENVEEERIEGGECGIRTGNILVCHVLQRRAVV